MITRTATSPITLVGLGLALVGWTIGGVWVTGTLTPNVLVHGATVAAFVSLTVGLTWMLTRETTREIRLTAIGAVALTMLLVLGAGAFLSRPGTVNERVVQATARQAPGDAGRQAAAPKQNLLVAEGSFSSLAHSTSGTAKVISLPDGSSKLTLTNFTTDPGPDLYVIAVAGNPTSDGEVKDYIRLGKLKGTSGNQQYDLPANFDAAKYNQIYIWCKAFTVGFGKAQLA